jgi:lysophospholipase L1-like esterase
VAAIADLSETLKSLSGKASGKTKQDIMKWVLGLSIGLNLFLLGVLVLLNERYGFLLKAERVVFHEGRVPGMAAPYEMNRNYQVRREMFRLDRNAAARVLMLGDSLTAQGEWNAMLGEPLVANRGIDGDTSAGLLARVGDDADFRGDAVVIWIGTNDVLQGESAGPVVERIMQVARRKAEILKKNFTTESTEDTEIFVMGIPPMATWVERGKELNATIREINVLLAEGAKENGYQFIELEWRLADESGFLRGDMTSDGVHLSAKGYEAVLEKMKESGLF